MIAKILTFTAAAFLVFSAQMLPAEETVFDGTFWRASSHDVKRFYVQGALGGVMLGQDRVIRRGQPGPDGSSLSPGCHRSVVRVVNALERELEQHDPRRLVEALDAFYDKPANRPLGVRWALITVLLDADDDGRQP